jgi:DNA-binding NarL/FixJ family response regulator
MTEAGRPVRVLVADDQKVVRDGLTMMLGLLDGIEVVGSAVDGADAIRQVESADPDVVLMDLGMPTVDGVEATRRLTAAGARARVVVLTTYADDQWVFGALQAGARGYLTKDAGAEEIRAAVLSVAAGDAQLDPSPQPVDESLTAREREVLLEIARGLSNTEVAERLFVSEATVKTHVNHLLAKTGCRDRAALVAYAYRTGMAPTD